MAGRKKDGKRESKRFLFIEFEEDGKWRTFQVCLNLKSNGEIKSFTGIKDLVRDKLCLFNLPKGILDKASRAYRDALAAEEIEKFWTATHDEENTTGKYRDSEEYREGDDGDGDDSEAWKRGGD